MPCKIDNTEITLRYMQRNKVHLSVKNKLQFSLVSSILLLNLLYVNTL